MRASIYVRISRDREGAGLGIGAQEQDCRALAEELGATVITVHPDNDLSAYSGKPRPGYKALLGEIARGEIDAVLCWHTDRLHRSPAELEDYITLCETTGVKTVTVKAGPIDLASPSGLVMARTHGAFARYEIDHARERMHRAKLRSAEAGKWKGGPRPFGYEPDGVTVRDAEAELIKQGADRLLAGESLRAVARLWAESGTTKRGGGQWDPNGVRRTMLRPRNAGLMEHRGEVVGGAEWPAILEREKWEAVVRILTDPSRRTNAHTTNAVRWLGSGLYKCGHCGGVVRGARDRQGSSIYRCRTTEGGKHISRLVEDVDRYVSAVIVERLRQPDLADLLRHETEAVDVEPLEHRAIELTERKNQLAAVFAEGGIDAAQLTEGSRALTAQLERVRAQIAAAYSGSALEGIGEAPDPGAAWLDAPLERQRLVLDSLVEVTLHPAPRGRPAGWKPGESYFRPDSVGIDWRAG